MGQGRCARVSDILSKFAVLLTISLYPRKHYGVLLGETGGMSAMHHVMLPTRMLSVTMEVYTLVYIILFVTNVERHELDYIEL